jgi:hypothetical protein
MVGILELIDLIKGNDFPTLEEVLLFLLAVKRKSADVYIESRM